MRICGVCLSSLYKTCKTVGSTYTCRVKRIWSHRPRVDAPQIPQYLNSCITSHVRDATNIAPADRRFFWLHISSLFGVWGSNNYIDIKHNGVRLWHRINYKNIVVRFTVVLFVIYVNRLDISQVFNKIVEYKLILFVSKLMEWVCFAYNILLLRNRTFSSYSVDQFNVNQESRSNQKEK